jgi:hypothetical protein
MNHRNGAWLIQQPPRLTGLHQGACETVHCPYFADVAATGTHPQCFGLVVPFEPSSVDQRCFCTTSRYRHCALYRHAHDDLSLGIHQEVARAIG